MELLQVIVLELFIKLNDPHSHLQNHLTEMSVVSLGCFPSDLPGLIPIKNESSSKWLEPSIDVLSPLAEFMLADGNEMDTAFFLETS